MHEKTVETVSGDVLVDPASLEGPAPGHSNAGAAAPRDAAAGKNQSSAPAPSGTPWRNGAARTNAGVVLGSSIGPTVAAARPAAKRGAHPKGKAR